MCARSQVSLIFGLDDLGTTHVNLLRMYAENTEPFTMIHVLMSLLHTVIWYGINDLMNDCLNKISKSNIIYIGTSLGSFFLFLLLFRTPLTRVPLKSKRFNSSDSM